MGSDPRGDFLGVFKTLTDGIKEDLRTRFDLPEEAHAYILRSIEYNVPHGKLNRGLTVVQFARDFYAAKGQTASDEVIFQASVLGWCIEYLQAFFLVADDIMDASITRRGQPCFYKLPEIGLKAVNDSIVLEALLYEILRKYFRSAQCYQDIFDLFHEITFTTSVGQLLDLTSQKEQGDVDLNTFSEANLVRIYKYKTAYYSFYLPVALGMHLCGIKDTDLFDTAKDICIDMGVLFQSQDDYIDCFGDPQTTGKIGTDIEDNKCTWLVVEALKVASPSEKNILQENYGRPDEAKVAVVKKLYESLELPAKFVAHESEYHTRLVSKIDAVEKQMPTGTYHFLLKKIFKRSS
uniref:Farnesyl diphosphate synthase n=1 Tax=Rhodosorus marinus TaxID=101924 RepID=A0A7S2ZFS9_9RHOD|mmetsp:Transcript_18216/g.72980  ORF Transcript_18216/g.72980 Transcript_18216/m.72980 type:complete len:350 (+) Transcript_18216:114-1163(+)